MNLDDPLDALLRALADATRRGLLDRLRAAPGLTLGELAAGVALSRQALSKHLTVLEAAGLVVPVWRGREKLHYLNPAPLQALPQRWIAPAQADAAAAALKQALKPAPRRTSDPLGALLLADPGAGRIADAAALEAARRWLAGTSDAVRHVIERLPPQRGYERPAQGGFSLCEHLWHLADLEQFGWADRLERLLEQKRPRLAGIDGDRLAAERDYQGQPWRGAARRFIAQRRRSLRALGRFDEAVLARPAFFAGRSTTAGDVVAAMVAHDREHREQIALLWETAR